MSRPDTPLTGKDVAGCAALLCVPVALSAIWWFCGFGWAALCVAMLLLAFALFMGIGK